MVWCLWLNYPNTGNGGPPMRRGGLACRESHGAERRHSHACLVATGLIRILDGVNPPSPMNLEFVHLNGHLLLEFITYEHMRCSLETSMDFFCFTPRVRPVFHVWRQGTERCCQPNLLCLFGCGRTGEFVMGWIRARECLGNSPNQVGPKAALAFSETINRDIWQILASSLSPSTEPVSRCG